MAETPGIKPFIPFWQNPDLTKAQVQMLLRFSHLESIPTSEVQNFFVARAIARLLSKNERLNLARTGGLWADAMAWDSDANVRLICASEAKRAESVERLLCDKVNGVLRAIIRRADVTPEQLERLALTAGDEVRAWAASSGKLTTSVMTTLSRDPSPEVRAAVIGTMKEMPESWYDGFLSGPEVVLIALAQRDKDLYQESVYPKVMLKLTEVAIAKNFKMTLAKLATSCQVAEVLETIAAKRQDMIGVLVINPFLPAALRESLAETSTSTEEVATILSAGSLNETAARKLLDFATTLIRKREIDCETLFDAVLDHPQVSPGDALVVMEAQTWMPSRTYWVSSRLCEKVLKFDQSEFAEARLVAVERLAAEQSSHNRTLMHLIKDESLSIKELLKAVGVAGLSILTPESLAYIGELLSPSQVVELITQEANIHLETLGYRLLSRHVGRGISVKEVVKMLVSRGESGSKELNRVISSVADLGGDLTILGPIAKVIRIFSPNDPHGAQQIALSTLSKKSGLMKLTELPAEITESFVRYFFPAIGLSGLEAFFDCGIGRGGEYIVDSVRGVTSLESSVLEDGTEYTAEEKRDDLLRYLIESPDKKDFTASPKALHDAVSAQVRKYKTANYRFFSEKEGDPIYFSALATSGIFFEFQEQKYRAQLATEHHSTIQWGELLSMCVGNGYYSERARMGQIFLLGVYDENGDIHGVIEVVNNGPGKDPSNAQARLLHNRAMPEGMAQRAMAVFRAAKEESERSRSTHAAAG